MKKFLSLVLALVMTMSLVTVAGAKDYSDGADVDYTAAIDLMSALEIVSGYGDGSFRPDVQLNRGQAAKIICNLILGPTTASALPTSVAPFSDVQAGHQFAGYIAYCAEQGIINGYTDGTFRPGNSLTGYAFMKMLLGVLGYDAELEGYVGGNWAVNVAKQALGIDLDDGLVGSFVGNKVVTRQEACLYAYNMLKAETVDYDSRGTDITIGDATINVGASPAEETGVRYLSTFNTLGLNENAFDSFGRPGDRWTFKGDSVAFDVDDVDATYTTAVKQKDLHHKLGLDVDVKAPATVYMDGTPATMFDPDGNAVASIDKAETDKIGNDGIVYEYYFNEVSKVLNVVIINQYFGTVDAIGKNADGERTVKVDGMDFVTDLYAEDDTVVYTATADTWPVDNDDTIRTMAATKKLTGKVTRIKDNNYTIGGTVYQANLGLNVFEVEDLLVGNTVDFWLDENGYIVASELASAEVKLDDLAIVMDTDTGFVSRAQLIFLATGKKEVVNTDADTYAVYAYKKGNEANALVKFDVNTAGEYELTAAADANKNCVTDYKNTTLTAAFEPGDLFMTTSAGRVSHFDEYTNFVIIDNQDNYSVTSYVGYKNAPEIVAGTAVEVYTWKAANSAAQDVVVMVLDGAAVVGNADKLAFLVAGPFNSEAEDADLGFFYTVNATAGGEIGTMEINDKFAGNFSIGSDDCYDLLGGDNVVVLGFKSLKVNGDKQVVDAASGYTSYSATYGDGYKNGVLYVGVAQESVSKDCKVFMVSSDDGSIVESNLNSIKKDNCDGIDNNGTADGYSDPYASIFYFMDSDGILVDYIFCVKN